MQEQMYELVQKVDAQVGAKNMSPMQYLDVGFFATNEGFETRLLAEQLIQKYS